jgi:hypothetical protein
MDFGRDETAGWLRGVLPVLESISGQAVPFRFKC